MPRVLVTTDDSARQVWMDERVDALHLDTGHSAEQLIERLAWGIEDAAKAERAVTNAVSPRASLEVAD